MRRLFIAGVFSVLSGCQCVSVPDIEFPCTSNDECAAGETCVQQRCVDVRQDGGVVGGGNTDAGSMDAGSGDAGSMDAGFDGGSGVDAGTDAGFMMCNSWSCVTSTWPAPSDGGTNDIVAYGNIPADVDGGAYGWFGGVLLPDGRVLAIASSSTQFLTFDPRTREVQRFGAPLNIPEPQSGQDWPRSYAGGVLHPNGMVYVFPYHAYSLLELNPRDGGIRPVGPVLARSDGGFPNYVGGVVDAYGTVWSVSESSAESVPVLRFDPTSGTAVRFTAAGVSKPRWGGWWGMARMPDDTLVAFPKEYFNGPQYLSRTILTVTPGPELEDAGFGEVAGFDLSEMDGGFPMQGGSLTFEGSVCGTAAGIETRYVCVSGTSTKTATMFPGPVDVWGFNGTFSDGNVWITPDSASRMLRIDGTGDVGELMVTNTERYSFLGMVATPQGMVLIPGAATQRRFVLVKPGGQDLADTRPMPVLLSPYFNKL
ncbi:MAG: hypothetical protein ACO1OB_06575 [Archangium sp.]